MQSCQTISLRCSQLWPVLPWHTKVILAVSAKRYTDEEDLLQIEEADELLMAESVAEEGFHQNTEEQTQLMDEVEIAVDLGLNDEEGLLWNGDEMDDFDEEDQFGDEGKDLD